MLYLVEAKGPVKTASTRRGSSVDCKINFLLGELRQFEMSITGISETKWLDWESMNWMGL